MTGWKNTSSWDCFAFVPLSSVEAARQKTDLEDQTRAGKSSERTGVLHQGHREPRRRQGPGSIKKSKLGLASPVPPEASSLTELLDERALQHFKTGWTCRGPFHELPSRGSWNTNREISQPLKLDTWGQKMQLQDIEVRETVLFGDLPFPFPHNPSQHKSPLIDSEVSISSAWYYLNGQS